MLKSESLFGSWPALFLAVVIIVVLGIFMRRLGMRLDKWFFRAIPLRIVGFDFFSYYFTVAMIWLFGIWLLFINELIDLSISALGAILVFAGTCYVAVRRRKLLNGKGIHLFKKR
jgi:hypothetical protein